MALVCWEADKTVGQGAKWSADRAQAAEMQDAQQGRSMSLEEQEAAQIAARIGLPVPPLEGTYEGESLEGQPFEMGRMTVKQNIETPMPHRCCDSHRLRGGQQKKARQQIK